MGPTHDDNAGERAAKRLKTEETALPQPVVADITQNGRISGVGMANTKPAGRENQHPGSESSSQPVVSVKEQPHHEDSGVLAAIGGNISTSLKTTHASGEHSAEKAESPQQGDAKAEEHDFRRQERSSRPRRQDDRDRPVATAPIKAEYLIDLSENREADKYFLDDDAAEGRGQDASQRPGDHKRGNFGKGGKKQKQRGQNQNRNFGEFDDAVKLCNSRAHAPEFSPRECRWGDGCRASHDLRKYLKEGRRGDLDTFDGKCVVFEAYGYCPSGFRCRFLKSHVQEIEREDGRKELVLIDKRKQSAVDTIMNDLSSNETNGKIEDVAALRPESETAEKSEGETKENGVKLRSRLVGENEIAREDKANDLDSEDRPADDIAPDDTRDQELLDDFPFPSGNAPEKGTEKKPLGEPEGEPDDTRPGIFNTMPGYKKILLSRRKVDMSKPDEYVAWLSKDATLSDELSRRVKHQTVTSNEDIRAQYVEPPFKPSEKRRLYFGKETPVLAPLTTQGNIPFRRLCVEFGAQLTYSEMAIGLPLVQGGKSDWALMKAHESEITPPRVDAEKASIVQGYDNSRDMRFGAQISGNHPWILTKAAYILGQWIPKLRLIDLNCGCPIDMIFKSGGGSGLLEHHGKMERMVRGMNAVSGEIPITVKLRTGVKSGRPQATTIIGKLAFGSRDARERIGAPGCAAITLHGRSREQRYTKKADWTYIAECAAMIKSYNNRKDKLADTVHEPDESTLPNSKDARMFFIGNGDCYSHTEYYDHIESSRVDSVMLGRGALIKPWVFEEIEKGQYLDKSATERLTYIEKFVRYGLETWGSDELGIGFTRRFLLEWLSFTCRYVPIGLLERLPASLNDRPPAYRGRNDLETLLASTNYRDWIKISEMFLGPAPDSFRFQPKHKSNSYEAEG